VEILRVWVCWWRSRGNLKIWSQNIELDFSGASISTISQDEIISPDGNQTADGIVPNTTNTAHYIDKVLTSTSGITASQKICSSVFFKKGVGKEGWFQVYEESGNAQQGLRFDFETKQLFYSVSTQFNTGGGVTDGYGVIEYICNISNTHRRFHKNKNRRQRKYNWK
jgi:hypothetical protein